MTADLKPSRLSFGDCLDVFENYSAGELPNLPLGDICLP